MIPHRFVCLNIWCPIGGTLWEGLCDLVGGGLSWRQVLKLQKAPVHSMPPACGLSCELSAAQLIPYSIRWLKIVFYPSMEKYLIQKLIPGVGCEKEIPNV